MMRLLARTIISRGTLLPSLKLIASFVCNTIWGGEKWGVFGTS